jgi:MFS family permease
VSKNTIGFPPNYRRNFLALLVDYISFGVALNFANISSVMPAFVGQLTDSAPVIGLSNTVFSGGWLLPQLAVARLISDKPRKKPTLLGGMGGRVLFWVIALALWAGLAGRPTAMLILFFVCLGLFAISDGTASVAWFEILSRAIPVKRRARLFGIGQFISGLVGMGVGALVGQILNRRPFPDNYALIFVLTGVAFIPSLVAMILLREPQPEEPNPATDHQMQGNLLKPLLDDPDFRRLMGCRLLVGMMTLTTSFYVVHAEDALHLPQSIIGDFVAAQTAGGVIASIVMGLVSERWGPRYVARMGSAMAMAGPLFALAAHLAGGGRLAQAYPFVYVALGVVNSTWMLGFFNYMLEIAPEGMCPAYVGLGNTLMGVQTLVPLAGGWLLEATSYTTLFSVTTVLVGAGFLLTLSLRPSQRRATAGQQP